jgi:hypothetical protein
MCNIIGSLSPSLLKVVANWVFILHFRPFCEVLCMGDGVDKFRVLVEAMFCFELIRYMTMRLLLVKFEQ